jgi:hypothetical protein
MSHCHIVVGFSFMFQRFCEMMKQNLEIEKAKMKWTIKTLLHEVYVPGKSDLDANNFFRDFEVQSNKWKKLPPFLVPSFSTPIFKAEFNKP